MRKNRKYSREECLSYLEGYLGSSLNQGQFEKKTALQRTQSGVDFVSLALKINQVPL